LNNLVKVIFFGNIFYGVIAVFMAIETNLLHGYGINQFPFYLLIFFGSWIYYTMIYVRSIHPASTNARVVWYRSNLPAIKKVLYVVLILVGIFLVILLAKNYRSFIHLNLLQWLLALSVPLVAALYTFHPPIIFTKKFRQIGWLKPFIVGFTWSGWVTVYPLLVYQMQHGHSLSNPVFPNLLFWLSNFIYITILAIIFDVKDYYSDVRHQLKTFPAQYGIHNTYRYILLPATLVNIAITIAFQVQQQFTFTQSFIQLIPFGILLVLVLLPQKDRSIFHYLVVIDGLMLLKAICGIISIQFF
jgi:4-hydroxybenzoate polyprenyltransferase